MSSPGQMRSPWVMPTTQLLVLLINLLLLMQVQTFQFQPIYQSEEMATVYSMPRKNSMQLKVFIECRRDCSTKCNHSLFAYLSNENECFTCLLECMSAFTQQAEKVGIHLNKMRKSKPNNGRMSDSLYAPGKQIRRRRIRNNVYPTESLKDKM
ncbi:unnamed protein product [Calicophoron daubneyi]|uniref:Uncharacterized protein n=1 Tax=Calicophoron daubneyi TaxID=300641 RepID=A0AAV2TAA1_CALDB